MRISDWSSDVCSSDLARLAARYGSAIGAAHDELTLQAQDWLVALPATRRLELEGRAVLLCHGAPWDTAAYVYPDADDTVFASLGASRSEGRRVGEECGSTCRFGRSRYH